MKFTLSFAEAQAALLCISSFRLNITPSPPYRYQLSFPLLKIHPDYVTPTPKTLQPLPFKIINRDISPLLHDMYYSYQQDADDLRFLTILFGFTGVVLTSFAALRLYQERHRYAALLQQSYERYSALLLRSYENYSSQLRRFLARQRIGPVESECVVCSTNPRDVILLHCGHICVCAGCVQNLPSNQCPICRANIERVQPFYVA